MADLLDVLRALEFLLGPGAVGVEGVRSPKTNLMALRMPPGASHFQTSPNPPLPERLDQAVAGDRLLVGLTDPTDEGAWDGRLGGRRRAGGGVPSAESNLWAAGSRNREVRSAGNRKG